MFDVGDRVGNVTIIGRRRRDKSKSYRTYIVDCRCDCGKEMTATIANLHSGRGVRCWDCGRKHARETVRQKREALIGTVAHGLMVDGWKHPSYSHCYYPILKCLKCGHRFVSRIAGAKAIISQDIKCKRCDGTGRTGLCGPDGKHWTLQRVAKLLGLSRQRVCQIFAKQGQAGIDKRVAALPKAGGAK